MGSTALMPDNRVRNVEQLQALTLQSPAVLYIFRSEEKLLIEKAVQFDYTSRDKDETAGDESSCIRPTSSRTYLESTTRRLPPLFAPEFDQIAARVPNLIRRSLVEAKNRPASCAPTRASMYLRDD